MATRRERVILDLDDAGYSSKLARNAAVTAGFARAIDAADGSTGDLSRNLRESGKTIDQYSGRLAIMAQFAAMLGPSLVPIGATVIPAVTGLAAQFGFAAVAAGSLAIASQGVGTALEAMSKARLEPTAQNLSAAREAMANLAPAAQEFVRTVQSMVPAWQQLVHVGQGALFPGATDGLEAIATRLPEIERIVRRVNVTLGDMLADSGESLASERWDDFFTFLRTDATSALRDMGATLGNVGHAAANMWMAFDPLNDDFSSWLRDSAAALDEWSGKLSDSEGFNDFVAYVRKSGPQVAETFGAIGSAMVDIVTAAAPLGGPVLQIVEALADGISALADSNLGTPLLAGLAAMSLLSRATAVWGSSSVTAARTFVAGQAAATRANVALATRVNMTAAEVKASQAAMGALGSQAAKGAAGVAALGLAFSGLGDKVGLGNTAMMASTGMLMGPWGAAVGAGVGLLLDWQSAQSEASATAQEFASTLDQATGAMTAMSREKVFDELVAEGALETVEKYGLSMNGLVDAIMAGGSAWEEYAAANNRSLGATSAGQARYYAELGDLFDASSKLTDEIDQGNAYFEARASVLGDASEQTGALANAAREAARAQRQFTAAVEAANRILSGRAGLRDYEQALDDLTKTLRRNGNSLDITTRKGRENQAALDNIASSALRVAENMNKTNRVKFLQSARRDLIDAAMNFGKTRAEAAKLADRLLQTDRMRVKPKVDADTRQANDNLSTTSQRLRELHRMRTSPKVDADTRSADSSIDRTSGKLRELGGMRATPKAQVDGGNSEGILSTIKAGIDRLYSKTVTITTYHDDIYRISRNGKPNPVRSEGWGNFDPMTSATAGGWAPTGKGGDGPNWPRIFKQFDINANQGASGVRSELNELKKSLKDAGKKWTKAHDQMAKQLLKQARQYDKASAAVERQTDTFRDLQKTSRAYSAQVAGTFKNAALGGSASDLMLQLQADTNDARAMEAALKRAAAKGLDGGLYKQLAASGNLALAQQLAGMSKAQIRQFEASWAAREKATRSLGEEAAQRFYGDSLAAAKRRMEQAERHADRVERRMERMERRLEKALRDAGRKTREDTRAGVRDGMVEAGRAAGARTLTEKRKR